MTMDPNEVARGLTEAQQEDFVRGNCRVYKQNDKCLCISPHRAEYAELGLLEESHGAQFRSEFGQQVLAALLSQPKGSNDGSGA